MTDCILIGAGNMAKDYCDVLAALSVEFSVVCRSEQSARTIKQEKQITCHPGGIEDYLANNKAPNYAIVAVGVENLFAVTMKLIAAGVQNVLVEKPAGLYQNEISALVSSSKLQKVDIYVAYNRRHFESVRTMKKMARDDGGLKSLHFDFTEWSDRIEPLLKGDGVKERWVLSNSTHVIDLAFHIAGKPVEITCFSLGGLNWHPSASRFSGAGKTESDVVFSYRAEWDAPGRWGVTAYSKNLKFDLCPLEELWVTKRNSVQAQKVDLTEEMNRGFKPGIYSQVKAFFDPIECSKLCSIVEHNENFATFLKIAGYKEACARVGIV